ncbi:hypothetical protein ACHAWO_004062 [Cyclotella atomus]|uniref:Reverse transcriptase domain-containing protein n=1 Tax=Cyclotella atomus TaxID=382360 RepID=A0ABD3N324_9STRA
MRSSQESENEAPPEEQKETNQQQRKEKRGDSTTGSSKGVRAAAKPTTNHPTGGSNGKGTSEAETEPQPESENGQSGGGNKPTTRASFNTPPTGPRTSPRTGALDAGSSAFCSKYNLENNLGPHEVGYYVMEEDPKIQKLRRADVLLMTVYGDTIHQNDGTHLDGGIVDDGRWQMRWRRVVSRHLSLWDPPSGKVGKRFVTLLANEWAGVRERRWNSERPIVFCAVILNRKTNTISASSIRKVVESRLDMWEAGCYNELVEEVVIRGKSGIAGSGEHSWNDDGEVSDSVAKRYNSMVLDGKIRSAVRFATGRGLGGPLQPTDTCSKAGIPVIEVLRKKHPSIRTPLQMKGEELEGIKAGTFQDDVPGFDAYPENPPAALPVDFDVDSMLVLSGKIHGSAGPGGVDANMLRTIFTRFGTASESIRMEWAKFGEWMCNESPPYAAYRALNAKREVGLDKQPGTRPLAVGEIWMRCIGKGVMVDAGDQAKLACGNVQLCAGLEAGIESSLHAVREVWDNNDFVQPDRAWPNDPYAVLAARIEEAGSFSEDLIGDDVLRSLPEMTAEGVALIDASNGFNELNRYCMLWNVGHRWPKGRRLAFNCYRHFNILIVRKDNGDSAYDILGEEGLSQGDPLAMVLYGIALMPLAEHLKRAIPEALTPWYADDSAAAGPAESCARALVFLQEFGPYYGYYPEPEKSYFICTAEEEAQAKVAFYSYGLKVQFVRGLLYLGGFIGGNEYKLEWVREKVKGWVDGVKILASVARRFPQMAYAGLTISLQNEWQYVMRTVPGIAALFDPLEKEIRANFLPALLEVPSISAEMRQLMAQGVKQAGLGIRNPVESADLFFGASKDACEELVRSMLEGDFNLAVHKAKVSQALTKAREKRLELESKFVSERGERRGNQERLQMKRAGAAGIWLTCVPSRLHGTELSGEEFRDNLRLRYNLNPLSIPSVCDGCGAKMTVEHALSCKVGGLVHIRHDDVADEFGHLCELAFSKGRVTHEPRINACESRLERKAREQGEVKAPTVVGIAEAAGKLNEEGDALEDVNPVEDARADATHSPYAESNENRGDKGVHGFWKRGRTCIFDVMITDTEGRSNRNQEPERVLAKCEHTKKNKHLVPCLERRRDFTPLVYSVDGMAGRETKMAERRLASQLAWKWKRDYSEMVGYVRTRMCLAVLRANTLLIRGSRERRSRARPLMDDGAAMVRWRHWRAHC